MITTRILDLPSASTSHAHAEHQLIVGLDGCADFEVMGKGGAVSRLHACLVPGDEDHAFSGRGSNHMLILDLAIEPQASGPCAEDGLGRLFERARFVRLDHRLQGLLDFASRELADRHFNDSPMSWHLGAMLLHALHDRLFSTPMPMRPLAALDMLQIEQYVQHHLDQPISVAALAAQACVSASHFFALFKQINGLTPHQYVLQARLKEASRLLCETPLPVAEVASRCGFSSQSALTHAIRRHTGLTPRRLRLGSA